MNEYEVTVTVTVRDRRSSRVVAVESAVATATRAMPLWYAISEAADRARTTAVADVRGFDKEA